MKPILAGGSLEDAGAKTICQEMDDRADLIRGFQQKARDEGFEVQCSGSTVSLCLRSRRLTILEVRAAFPELNAVELQPTDGKVNVRLDRW